MNVKKNEAMNVKVGQIWRWEFGERWNNWRIIGPYDLPGFLWWGECIQASSNHQDKIGTTDHITLGSTAGNNWTRVMEAKWVGTCAECKREASPNDYLCSSCRG